MHIYSKNNKALRPLHIYNTLSVISVKPWNFRVLSWAQQKYQCVYMTLRLYAEILKTKICKWLPDLNDLASFWYQVVVGIGWIFMINRCCRGVRLLVKVSTLEKMCFLQKEMNVSSSMPSTPIDVQHFRWIRSHYGKIATVIKLKAPGFFDLKWMVFFFFDLKWMFLLFCWYSFCLTWYESAFNSQVQ